MWDILLPALFIFFICAITFFLLRLFWRWFDKLTNKSAAEEDAWEVRSRAYLDQLLKLVAKEAKAPREDDQRVKTVHILLALLRDEYPHMASFLQQNGISREKVAQRIATQVGTITDPHQDVAFVLAFAENTVLQAYKKQGKLMEALITPEYILYALAVKDSGLGGQILREQGLDGAAVWQRVIQQLPVHISAP